MNSLDQRLKRAADELTGARNAEDEVGICYWYAELERLLDEKSAEMAKAHV